MHLASTIVRHGLKTGNGNRAVNNTNQDPCFHFLRYFIRISSSRRLKLNYMPPPHLLQSVPYLVFYFLVNNSIHLDIQTRNVRVILDYLIDVFLITIKSTFQCLLKSSPSSSSTSTLQDHLGSACIKGDSFMPTSWC